MKRSELRQIIREEIAHAQQSKPSSAITEAQEQDFVVGGTAGGYDRSAEHWTYIVTAKNRTEAKRMLRNAKPSLKRVYAEPVTSYKYLDPYQAFARL